MSSAALREHLHLLDDLAKIVSAMRNLAYAEVQRLSRMTKAQARSEQVLLQAMADSTEEPTCTAYRAFWVVIGAERGFCGGFNERLQDALPGIIERYPDADWFAAGERLNMHVGQQLPAHRVLAGCSTAEEAGECADAWFDTLWSCWSAATLPGTQLYVLHHSEKGLCERQLLPLPSLPPLSRGSAPLRTLPAAILLSKLQTEWLRVGLLGALFQSLQQENRWRLAQMQRAQDHLDEAGMQLKRAYFRHRQADITSELETLMSSLDVNVSGYFGRCR